MAIELQDKLYTSAQVADVLGVSLRTLYRYMEDGKIESMKTASGRHRFTKEQILSFLDGDSGMGDEASSFNANPRSARDDFSFSPSKRVEEKQPERFNDFESSSRGHDQNVRDVKGGGFSNIDFDDFDEEFGDESQSNEDNDDFNFDFRSERKTPSVPQAPYAERQPNRYAEPARSSSNFGAVRSQSTPTPQKPPAFDDFEDEYRRPVRTNSQPVSPYGNNNSSRSFQNQSSERGFGTNRSSESPRDNNRIGMEGLNVRYYKSDYNDLIDLAKRIKEAAISKDLEYAFTLNAGLSLHFLIDPFTLLHFYVNPEDLQVWKSVLGLVPVANKSDANIGVLVNTDVVFIPTKEIGGFKVVEDKVLLRDLMKASEDILVKEFRQRIFSA